MENNQKHQESRKDLFNNWAKDYDRSVDDIAQAERYPFAGYDAVMDGICREAEPGMDVLDLGTGTGNLASRLLKRGCCVWGTDFSPAMLDSAREKLPGATLVEADLRADWPGSIDGPFDRIVSAYVLHEFELPTKIAILQQACGRLSPGGCVVVGDIAFSTRLAQDEVSERWHETWDGSEHYWVADEALDAAEAAGISGRWTEISECAGVFVFSRPTG